MSPSEPYSADETLLRLIRNGNEAALRMLYEQRGGMVYSLALSIVRSVDDAEEVTQQVFLKIWQHAQSFQPVRGSALVWMTTMTRRTAIDRTRSKHYKGVRKSVPLDDMLTISSNTGNPLAAANAREVRDAVAQLDNAHQEVIRLSYFEGLSHSQIAEHLDTPIGTIKSRIREAVIKLRRFMDAG